jgi:hypothetical protein
VIPVAIGLAVILVAAIAVAISLASDDEEQVSTGTTKATSTTETTSTGPDDTATTTGPEAASPGPSAADDLVAFFAAVDRVDQRLEAAADQYNATIGPDTVRVDEAMWETVRAINPDEAGAAIPAGLPPDLLLEVLIVQDDLSTRSAALEGALGRADRGEMEEASGCLENGRVKAERFGSDVAAAKALAGSSPPIEVAAPDSRAAGELALRLSVIHTGNYGCDACGGPLSMTELYPINWYDAPRIDPDTNNLVDGTIDLAQIISFKATYTPGEGWQASIIAC